MRIKRRLAGAGMERADVQQEAALDTAAPPTVERQREQQRIQAPFYSSPRHPRLRQLSSPVDTQPSPIPAQPLLAASTGDTSDSDSPVSGESAGGPAEGSGSQVPRPKIAGSEEQQEEEERSQRQCSHCGSPHSAAKWRRHSTTRARLCSACGQYERKNNGRLPSAAVLQRRAQKRLASPPSPRQCLQCGASTPGLRRYWTRHPATKEGWLCHKCYHCAWKELKCKRQHKAAEGGCSSASGSDGGEESGQEVEEAQPPSQSAASPQQQAAPVQPSMPDLPVQQQAPATVITDRSAEQQQQQQPQGVNPDATWETASEQPALLPAQVPPAQASTGLLVLEAAPQAAAAAAGLTEGLAGTFVALLPMPAEQDECLRLMLQRRQYSGAAGLMRALLHMRCILPAGVHPACPERR